MHVWILATHKKSIDRYKYKNRAEDVEDGYDHE